MIDMLRRGTTLLRPVQGFRPQYPWDKQFSLAQFEVVRLPPPNRYRKLSPAVWSYRLTAAMCDLVGAVQCDFMSFTVTSPQTGMTILFEYVYDDLTTQSLVFAPSRTDNGHVPNIEQLRDTLRAGITL